MTLELQSTIMCVYVLHMHTLPRPVGGTRLVLIIQKGKPEAEEILIVKNVCSHDIFKIISHKDEFQK